MGRFQAVTEIMNVAAALDPSFIYNVDLDKTGRAAIQGAGAPEEWLNSEKEVSAVKDAQAKKAEMQEQMAMVTEGAEAVGAAQAVSNG